MKLGLQAWLALVLAAGVLLPALLGFGAWVVVDGVQAGHQSDRVAAARAVIAATSFDSTGDVVKLQARLQAMAIVPKIGGVAARDPRVLKELAIGQEDKASTDLAANYDQYDVFTGNAKGTLFVPKPSSAPRWAAALGAGLVGLIIVLGLAIAGLRRWVARPLAQLADGADRIAGGDLNLPPVSTRAREVDQVATAMRGMAAELGTALAASDAAERERRFVVTAIAHDLRTPLFTLRGSLQAIQRGIGNGEYVALAQRKADHLDHLVSDLFALSKLDYAPSTDAVDLAALAREVAEQYEIVTVSASRALVAGDAAGLLRVLTNLVDNAVRHAESAVHIDVRGEGDEVVVTVSDDGPGIAPALLDRVFEPLVTADGARRGGAGLGLAIVERIVTAHGGSVAAANDGGAVVTVRLRKRSADSLR